MERRRRGATSRGAPSRGPFAGRQMLAVLLAAGCGAPAAVPGRAKVAVRVHAVGRASAASGSRYSATINPATRVEVAFKVGGYIEAVARVRGIDGRPRLLQAGDAVKRGLELASVRRSDYTQKLAEAQAALAEASAAREQAQIDFNRASKLAGTISQAEVDAARVRLDASVARSEGARVRVSEAQTALGDAAVRAPLDGVVLQRFVELGTLAAPGTVAFSVADTSSVKAVYGVPDTVLETLRLGSPQALTLEALPGVEQVGRISRIAPAADAKSRVFEVEVTLPNPKDEIKPGMVASLKLSGAPQAAPVAVLPLSAVVRSPSGKDRFAVFVVDDKAGVARRREVELGEFLGNLIPVKTGLAEGERVVVMGAALLSDGEPVEVIP